ncbi:enterobactin synthetase [Streptomyces longwoodensis]|uniref:enterobactin synthetase n=1 Tax=Streptomyces longwoodensis TaxID=68231 RepID=UPI0033EBE8E5
MRGAGLAGGSDRADRDARTAGGQVTAGVPAVVAALTRLRPHLAAAGLGLGLAQVGEPGLGPAGPAEASAAATMTPGRRREFLAGRQAARRALRAVGVDCGEIPREGRLPVFAPGRSASISHSAGIAVAVARAPGGHAPLGCDLELRLLPCEAARLVLAPDEESLLGTPATAGGGPWSLTGLFSAKEAAWKALHLVPGRAGTASMRTLRDLRAEPYGDALHIGPRIDPHVGPRIDPRIAPSSRPRIASRAGQSYGVRVQVQVRVRVLPVGAGVFSYAVGWADADGRSTPVPTARRS